MSLLLLAGAPSGAPAATGCGIVNAKLPSGKTGRVAVRIASGDVACDKARRVAKRYLDTRQPYVTPGWLCAAGHAGRKNVASCRSFSTGATIVASRAG